MHTPTKGPDPADFTMFMRAYQDMVFTTAARLTGDDVQGEDIAQETFVRAYQHFPALQGSPTAGGWLKTVATNLALNHLTRHRRRFRLFSELRISDEEGESAEPDWEAPGSLADELAADQRGALVDAALKGLPDHQRLPLVLYHFEEMPYAEISRRLNVSLAKVKTDIRRARLALLPVLKSRLADERQSVP